ncbi:MAG: DnaD domain protein, partial [Oscillospiraceae bacterium]|nr:DnaD domain protein [Oscillospiraceae bacterium]
GISVDDAKDLLDYWTNRGILECDGISPAPEVSSAPAVVSVPTEKSSLPKPPETKLTMKEVQRLKDEDPGIAHVLSEAERILGKTFTSSDTETIVWLISYAGVPAEVLITVMAYCSGIGKNNLRYIQKVALEWLDSGIDTIEAAEERINALNEARSWEGEVKHALEIYGRNLVTKEKEYCESWRLYSINPELIHFAYEKCIEKTAKLSFPYINKLLLSWHQKGFKTPEEAAAENRPKTEKEKPSFDLDELERRMMLEDSVI